MHQSLRSLILILLTITLAPSPARAEQASAEQARPNIVFAFADDWGRYASAYREADRATINDVFETPHFDSLAEQGVLFWDVHVSSPSCTPSRTAVLTGRHFFRNGSGAQLHSPWSGDPKDDPVKQLESYHTLLDDAGYHTGVTYKTHVSMHLFVDKSHQYNKAGDATGYTELGNEFIITGRERHVGRPDVREGALPYPSRAIRTKDFLYIKNFKPDRWPQLLPPMKPGLRTHGDFDGGPTKQWFAEIQDEPKWAEYVDWAWGKRPDEELYDLNADPDQMNNLADAPQYAAVKKELSGKLMDVLVAGEDPRIVGEGDAFDRPPYWKLGR